MIAFIQTILEIGLVLLGLIGCVGVMAATAVFIGYHQDSQIRKGKGK